MLNDVIGRPVRALIQFSAHNVIHNCHLPTMTLSQHGQWYSYCPFSLLFSKRRRHEQNFALDNGQDVTSTRLSNRSWWSIKWFHGMTNDIRRRAPFYWSDWTDAWDYRVIPATVYVYFVSWMPMELIPVLFSLAENTSLIKPYRQSMGPAIIQRAFAIRFVA